MQVTQLTQYTMIEFKLRIDQFKLLTNQVHVPMNFLTLLFIFLESKVNRHLNITLFFVHDNKTLKLYVCAIIMIVT